MAKIAILGFGTVGSGVLEVLRQNAPLIRQRAGEAVEVKYILDVRDFSSHPDAALFVREIDTILSDPEVRVVVETIGGTKYAYPYVKQALASGRSVATSNKELVATHGAELLALAKQNGAAFLFEASVGGGTPLIAPMFQSMAANRITAVQGIVNGTTNFILTKMASEQMEFAEALGLAQQLGYAETRDSSDDLDGIDAARKLAILASIAGGVQVCPEEIPTRGIRGIEAKDIAAANRLGCAIKLIAHARFAENGALCAGVEPMLVPNTSRLYGVDDVFNAVQLTGDMLGEVLFYGKGAGKLATASAVAADAVMALRYGAAVHDSLFWQPAPPSRASLTDPAPAAYYVRVSGLSLQQLPALCGPGRPMADALGEDIIYLANSMDTAGLDALRKEATAAGGSLLALRRMDG